MLKLKTINSPTLGALGQFAVSFGEFAAIKDADAIAVAVRADIAAGNVVIPVTNGGTTGFGVGQLVLIRDMAGHAEVRVVAVVTAGPPSTIQVGVAIANTYTVANGSTMTVICPRVLVGMTSPFTANLNFATAWTKLVQLLTGTATPTVLPAILFNGANLVAVGGAGNVTLFLPPGVTGTAVSGTAAVAGTPQALAPGDNTIALGGAGNFTVTLSGVCDSYVIITVEKGTVGAGPAQPWAVAATAEVAGMVFSVLADGE
jgi:hypothetical protein